MDNKTRMLFLVDKLVLQEKYRLLSELWEQKSKHRTHLKISKMIDDVLVELKDVEEKLKGQ